MANSPLVSIRIPPEILERVDRVAQELYPSRRVGKKPNRSQVILDAIVQFLEQYESDHTDNLSFEQHSDDEQINRILPKEQSDDEPSNQSCHPYSMYKTLQHSPKYMEPPIQEYIDCWLAYFSYMKKLTDVWFRNK